MLKKFLTGLSTALMVLAIGAALLFGWSKTGWKALSIPTGSMEPNISQGSLAVVRQVSPNSLKIGDVITYTDPLHNNRTLTHRIIKTYILPGSSVRAFVTKGDANKVQDMPVTSGSVIGKVTWHAPHLGSLLLGSKTWIGLAVLIYLPALLLIIQEIKRMADYLRLSIPYKLYGYKIYHEEIKSHRSQYIAAGTLTSLLLVATLAFSPAVFALLRSNAVSLSPNILTVAGKTTPPSDGGTTTTTTNTNTTCTNNTNVSLNNTSGQTASSGNANTSGNTTGGSATSGNATNTSTTSGTVIINNSGC